MSDMNSYVVGILGASGFGNVGDDIIANILERYLKDNIKRTVEIRILSNPRKDEDILGLDVLVIGGGGLIYDYDMSNVDNYCQAIHQATNYRIPVYMMGIGVQHVFSDEAKEKYRHALGLVKAITTRGEYDTNYIRDTLGYRGQLIKSRDIAFLYGNYYKVGNTKQHGSKKKLAISLSDWKLGKNYEKIKPGLALNYKQYRSYLMNKLPNLKQKYDITIVCQAHEDEAISNELSTLLGVPIVRYSDIQNAPDIVQYYERMDLVITNRYHGFIASLLARTPVIAVSFSGHKTEHLVQDSFPSLRDQYFEIDHFVKDDIIAKLADDSYGTQLRTGTERELKKCVVLAGENEHICKYILGEIDRLYA